MATSTDDTQVFTFRRYNDDENVTDMEMSEMIFVQDTSYKCPTYIQKTPPCQGSCPAGEDIRGWLQIVRGIEKPLDDSEMAAYAFKRSTTANPFPSVMGRVCPAPCQDGCNRNDVDDFVGINAVEQFIGDQAIEHGYHFNHDLPELTGKKIAIIGAGPAGMTAAFQLRKMGHESVVFDDHEEMGGMMRYGIPNYRIPRDVLERENQRIIDMGGIEFRGNTRVGEDVSVADLESEYDAILWALGCWTGRGLFIDNWKDIPNCVTAVDFLEKFNQGEMRYTAAKVVCVGGGDTSIDVVSVSKRIGTRSDMGDELPEDSAEGRLVHDKDGDASAQVTLTALFKQEEMTAAEHEIHDALREGVTIMNEVMPIEIITNAEGRATGLKVVECEMDGNMPKPKEGGKETIIEADLIVSAIGQFGDMTGLEDMATERGDAIASDSFYQVPDKEKHFAAGDIVRPHLLTTAIGQASIAAESIQNYFNGIELRKRPKVDKHHFELLGKLAEANLSPEDYTETKAEDLRGTDSATFAVHNYDNRSEHAIIDSTELFLGHFEKDDRYLRTEDVPTESEVLGHFAERMNGYDTETAQKEADRCMSCGMCFECDNCVIYCPQDAVGRVAKDKATLGRYVETNYDRCIGCHICADVCPTGYIEMGLGE